MPGVCMCVCVCRVGLYVCDCVSTASALCQGVIYFLTSQYFIYCRFGLEDSRAKDVLRNACIVGLIIILCFVGSKLSWVGLTRQDGLMFCHAEYLFKQSRHTSNTNTHKQQTHMYCIHTPNTHTSRGPVIPTDEADEGMSLEGGGAQWMRNCRRAQQWENIKVDLWSICMVCCLYNRHSKQP